MTTPPPPLRRDGDRVWVASVDASYDAAYRRAVEGSRARLEQWNPVEPHVLPTVAANQSHGYRSFLVHARDPEGSHGLVGKVNINSIVRGRLLGGTLGYDAFDPYAGRGLFTQGLRLVVDLAFTPEAEGGLGLHRLEANVQPGNTRSAVVLRRLGFTREGFSPGYLWLSDTTGEARWRDHDRYAVLAGEWPSRPFLQRRPRRLGVVVTGGAERAHVAADLAVELGLPFYDDQVVPHPALLWRLLRASVTGGVVSCAPDTAPDWVAAGFDEPGCVVRCADEPYDAAAVTRLALEARSPRA
ncbi:GNAT family protein [Dermatophilaceae bacterium Soc4.6]